MSDLNDTRPIRVNKPGQILRILRLRLQGKSIHQIGRELQISAPAVFQSESRIVKDYPRILRFVEGMRQIGYFKMGGPYMRPLARRTLPKGYKYVDGKPVVDPATAPQIREIFRLKIEKQLGPAEIGRRLGMDPSAVNERLHNLYYANKKLVKGNWVDDNHEPLISFKEWKAAQQSIPGHNWDAAVKKRRQVKAANKNKILACLGTNEKTLGEISMETGLSKATAHRLLLECQKESLTEKNPPGKAKGKWRIRTSSIMR